LRRKEGKLDFPPSQEDAEVRVAMQRQRGGGQSEKKKGSYRNDKQCLPKWFSEKVERVLLQRSATTVRKKSRENRINWGDTYGWEIEKKLM